MDGLLDLVAKLLKSDSPVAAWKFCNWLLLLWVWPFVSVFSFADTLLFVLIVASICAISSILPIGMFFALRRKLVSIGVSRNELDAVSTGVVRSFRATSLVALPMALGVLILFFWSSHLIADWFANDLVYFIWRLAISVVWWFALYMGWLLWGRQVYKKHFPTMRTIESQ